MNHSMLPQTSSTIAYTFGTADAKHGASFAPEMYYVRHEDMRNYALGYEAITGPTVFTAQFTDAEIIAEAEDLEEDMLDREFFSRGMW